MPTKWIDSTGAKIDTRSAGITANGTYYLDKLGSDNLDPTRPFIFGARVASAGHTATIQLFAEVAGAKMNLGSALVPTNGSPVIAPDEYTLTGKRGIVVTGITGTVYPEVGQ